MKDPLFFWSMMVFLPCATAGYFFWSRGRVPEHAKLGWKLEMGGIAVAYVGVALAFATGNVRIGALAIFVGFCTGLVGLFLFTRPSKD